MRAADKAWVTLAVGILAYEIAAPRGELMSEGMDRYLEALQSKLAGPQS